MAGACLRQPGKTVKELRIQAGSLSLSALHRQGSGPKLICLHGWLDNGASFLPLSQALNPDYEILALDFPGHGHSDHRPAGSRYHFVDYLWDVIHALDRLQWDQCYLMGHSLGGAVSAVLAATIPDRIKGLILLDGLGPLADTPVQTTQRLRDAAAALNRTSQLKRYTDPSQAVEARHRASGLLPELAEDICLRNLKRDGEAWIWQTDTRLNRPTAIRMTEEQILDCMAHIQAPTLAIGATPVPRWFSKTVIENRLASIPDCQSHWLPGHHHFHLDQAEQIASLIHPFISGIEHHHESEQK